METGKQKRGKLRLLLQCTDPDVCRVVRIVEMRGFQTFDFRKNLAYFVHSENGKSVEQKSDLLYYRVLGTKTCPERRAGYYTNIPPTMHNKREKGMQCTRVSKLELILSYFWLGWHYKWSQDEAEDLSEQRCYSRWLRLTNLIVYIHWLYEEASNEVQKLQWSQEQVLFCPSQWVASISDYCTTDIMGHLNSKHQDTLSHITLDSWPSRS